MAEETKPRTARPAITDAKIVAKPAVPASPVAKPVVPASVAKPAAKPVPVPPQAAKPDVVTAPPAKPAAVPAPKPPVVTPPVAAKLPVAKPPVAAKPAPSPRAPAAILAAQPLPVAAPAPAHVPVPPEPIAKPAEDQPNEPRKDETVNETITNTQNGTADAIKSGATAAYSNGKAALEQVTAKSKETIEAGMKQMDELSAMSKANVEALLASAKAATAGLEAIAHQVADFSRKSFEETTAVARAMTTVKTPNEFMQLQNDFAKKQFDSAVSEMSKMSETLVKLAGEVFEPVQNRVAVATDKMKSAVGTGFKN